MTDAGPAAPGAAVTTAPDSAAPAVPGPLERGRYAVFEESDGGLVIARSGPLCERCAGCGCGDRLEPLKAPAMLVQMARNAAAGGNNVLAALKAARGGRGR